MSDDDDDNVKRLPVRFKEPAPADRSLLHLWEVTPAACSHYNYAFIVDERASTVECSNCHASLNPMWVLQQLCNRDRRFHESHARYNDEMRRLAERSSTKCQYCGKMTRISHR